MIVSEHTLLVRHAKRWADTNRRPLDADLLETVLHLKTTRADRWGLAWPGGSVVGLVLRRWPTTAPSELPSPDALLDTLNTYWRFLGDTGRMGGASATPDELIDELLGAIPRMAEAARPRSVGPPSARPDDVDREQLAPQGQRGILALRQAREAGFSRQVRALVDWVGTTKQVTQTGVLRAVPAREAYLALDLASWDRQHLRTTGGWPERPPPRPEAELRPEDRIADAATRARAIKRAGECVALERLWWPARACGLIETTISLARPGLPPEWDELALSVGLVTELAERLGGQDGEVLILILHRAMRAVDGVIDLACLREEYWETSELACRSRARAEPERHSILRHHSDWRVAWTLGQFDDTGIWVRSGDHLRLTEFGRELAAGLVPPDDDN